MQVAKYCSAKKMEEIHKSAIDLSRSIYIDAHTHVVVGCRNNPEHGFWSAAPTNLTSGKGCPECGNQSARASKRLIAHHTGSTFYEDVEKAHGSGVIDLSKAAYIHSNVKVEVGCLRNPNHGFWFAWPGPLKRGVGCPICAKEGRARISRGRAEASAATFREDVERVHGPGIIDLTDAVYINNRNCPGTLGDANPLRNKGLRFPPRRKLASKRVQNATFGSIAQKNTSIYQWVGVPGQLPIISLHSSCAA